LDWWEQAASDAVALSQHLRYQKAILFGFSGGGIAALLAAALYPEHVSAVIADSCVEKIAYQAAVKGRTMNPLAIFKQESNLKNALIRIVNIPRLAAFWRYGHGPDWKKVVQADSQFLLDLDAAGVNVLDGCLPQIKCPVLITASLTDEALMNVRQQIEAMQQKIPDCRVFLSKKGSHPLCWSQPEIFKRAVTDFLNSLN
jgi:valacyclovir hydrolase